METFDGELILMSLATNRYLGVYPDGRILADSPGPRPDGQDGVRLRWRTRVAGYRWSHVGRTVREGWRTAGRKGPMRKPLGLIRLQALPAPDVWYARTALTLYAVEPRSTVTVALNVASLKVGDIAGLALFNRPYAWLGVERLSDGLALARFDERSGKSSPVPLRRRRVWLRAECDFVRNEVVFRYSTDGRAYAKIGESHIMGDSPTAAHGIPCSLFSCTVPPPESTRIPAEGGYADFDSFVVTTERGGRQGG